MHDHDWKRRGKLFESLENRFDLSELGDDERMPTTEARA
jgi:RNase H-fold protein (predicted Holliday junction resolvase)